MDIDIQFPILSLLAQKHKYTLKELSKMAPITKDGYLGLSDCCYVITNNVPRWLGGDAYNYLFTLNKFLNELPDVNNEHEKIWKKITGSQSSFLDTVIESAWVLHFRSKGISVHFEEPLPDGKDADIMFVLNNTTYWLDVLNISLDKSRFSVTTLDTSSIDWPIRGEQIDAFAKKAFIQPQPSPQELIEELAKRAVDKYKRKFKENVISGAIQDSKVGILLCVLKAEKYMVPLFFRPFSSPPPILFSDKTPGLKVVWVHTLRPDANSDLLIPNQILPWMIA